MEMIWPAKEEGGQPTIVRYKITPNPKVRLEAAQWLAERGWGKPVQEVAMTRRGRSLSLTGSLQAPRGSTRTDEGRCRCRRRRRRYLTGDRSAP
jgi:hypothetical protein